MPNRCRTSIRPATTRSWPAVEKKQPRSDDENDQDKIVYRWTNQGDTFVWYHGDKGAYPDDASYGCVHRLMGAHGHQGVVSVVVSDGVWHCDASIKGSNLSTTAAYSDKPACRKVGAASDQLLRVLEQLDEQLDIAIDRYKKHPTLQAARSAAGLLQPFWSRELGPLPGTDVSTSLVLALLEDADGYLAGIERRAGVSPLDLKKITYNFGRVHDVLDRLHDELAGSGDEHLVTLGTKADDLAAEARQAKRQAHELKPADIKAKAARMAQEKHQLIARLPKIDLLPAAQVYAAYATMQGAFVDYQYETTAEGVMRQVEKGRAAKEKLERALKAAAGS